MIGKIKSVKQQGFGFIRYEGGVKDVYFHASKVVDKKFDELKEGHEVEFDLAENGVGQCAENVVLLQ